MMKSIIRFSLKQKIFFNLVFILLTMAGFFALFAMPMERFPNINFGEVTITTQFPGASPIEIETLITRKLEETLDTIENIEWVNSTSYPERSHIRIKFIDDSDYAFLYNEVRLKILNMMGELPQEVEPPIIDNVTIDDLIPVIFVNLGSTVHSNRALSLMADMVKIELQKLDGVKEVIMDGEFVREFHIYLDPDKLRRSGISFSEVSDALQAVNISIPAGNFKTHSGKYLIKVDEKFHQREQVVRTIIRRVGDGGFTRLEDLISRADLGYREPVIISTVNGKEVVSLRVVKTAAGNALEIKEQLVKSLESFQPMFEKEGLEVTLTRDSTLKIRDGLSTLSMNMLAGMILVSLIIWYFMGGRNASLVTIGIPFAFMMTTLLMYLTGNSLNELTLFAFVLVSGIIVDDAIVVSENIYRHVQDGRDFNQAIVEGVSEVALPVISSTLTTIAAFVPMLIMTGSTGEFFAQIPTAVSYALIASLFECLLILPIHYQHFGPRADDKFSKRLEKDNFIIDFARKSTDGILTYTLKHRRFSIMGSIMLFAVTMGILLLSVTGKLALLKIQFFPDDYSVYYADIKGPSETSINVIDSKLREMAKVIIADGSGAAESAVGIAGFYVNDAYQPVYGNNYGTILVTLPEKDKQTFDDPHKHLEKIREKLKKLFEMDGYILDIHAQKDGPRTGKALSVRILGSNNLSILGLADKLSEFLRNDPKISPWLIGFDDDRGHPKRIYRFDVLHERVSEYDLNSGDVARLAGSVLDGQYIGKYRLNDQEIDLKLFIEPEAMDSLQDALTIPFLEHSTSPILLGDVTRLRTYKEQGELHRYQGQRSVNLKADLKAEAPISAAVIMNSVKKFYETVRLDYPGATLTIGGEQESTQRSFQSLVTAFVIAIMVIYIILAAQFQSYMQPVIILAAVIFALIGVILGKLITQSLFTVNSFMAIIGVAGVVVNDSLMLVDFMNKSYHSGCSRRDAIYKAIKVRLRPILLTTLTTTLGLLPMAIGIPDYSIVWGAMASTFVVGLAVATILTLVIIPVLWDFLQERRERKYTKKELNKQ